jgi:hypothetical protein
MLIQLLFPVLLLSFPNDSHPRRKFLERRLVRIWKRATNTVRRKQRASILPDGFVLLNAAAARRRSLYINTASI